MPVILDIAKRLYLVRTMPYFWHSILILPRDGPQVAKPPTPDIPSASPLRFGILGAAKVAPIALIYPVKSHPDAVVTAVAARDQGRANAFAKKYDISKAYGGSGAYQSMLSTDSIDTGVLITNRRAVGRP